MHTMNYRSTLVAALNFKALIVNREKLGQLSSDDCSFFIGNFASVFVLIFISLSCDGTNARVLFICYACRHNAVS